MKLKGEQYTLSYDSLEQQVDFDGTLRPNGKEEVAGIDKFLKEIYSGIEGTMKLNFRKLRYFNSHAFWLLSNFIRYAKQHQKLKIRLIGSKVLTWENKSLPRLKKLWEGVEYIIHDENFYGGQNILENEDMIPTLKRQTRLTWPLEKNVLSKHGLKAGMRVADICCGIGDFALHVAKELEPSYIIGIDHAASSIEYARSMQIDTNVGNIEYRLGDATAIMLDDESFDFVSCRLSLQIFSKPEEIVRELYRILKPGGRLYLVNEDYDLIYGHPNEEEIKNTYTKSRIYSGKLGMDFYSGRKIYSYLKDVDCEDIKIDYIHVDTNNSDREAIADTVKSWKKFFATDVANDLNLSPEEKQELENGFEAQLKTIHYPHGYTCWTLIAGSGMKKKQ